MLYDEQAGVQYLGHLDQTTSRQFKLLTMLQLVTNNLDDIFHRNECDIAVSDE